MPNDTCLFNDCANPSRARGWCWPHYKQWHRGEALRPVGVRKSAAERLWLRVEKTPTCWNWTGPKVNGYGNLDDDNKFTTPAHRLSYQLANGPIPDGLHIDHICHNRACVNPDHLRAVTQKQNNENRSGPQANSKTGIRGVYLESKTQKYIAIVNHHGRRHYVGSFHNLEEAAEAAKAKRMELFTHNNADWQAA